MNERDPDDRLPVPLPPVVTDAQAERFARYQLEHVSRAVYGTPAPYPEQWYALHAALISFLGVSYTRQQRYSKADPTIIIEFATEYFQRQPIQGESL